jgi:hypothetical protein
LAAIPTGAQEWKPTDTQLAHLGEEKRFDRYAIRPPAGTKPDHRQVGREDRHVWAADVEGKSPGIIAVTQTPRAAQGDPVRELQALVDLMKTRTTNMKSGKVETGTLNGQKFARVRFRADAVPGLRASPINGFVFITFVPEGLVQLTGFGTDDTIERTEASAYTFRIVK